MAEVGVLNLEIKHNAGEAAHSLRELAGALTRVKNAVSKTQNLKSFATGLESMKRAMQGSWGSESKFSSMEKLKEAANAFARNHTAQKLKDVASALRSYGSAANNIGGIGDFGDLKVRTSLTNLSKSNKTALDKIGDDVARLTIRLDKEVGGTTQDAFTNVAGRVDEVKDNMDGVFESVENVNETLGNTDNVIKQISEDSKEANRRIKELNSEIYKHASGDLYGGRPNNTPKILPTDLTDTTSPQALALLGEWGENLQRAAMYDERHKTGESMEELRARIEAVKASLQDTAPYVNQFANEMERMNDIIAQAAVSWNATGMFENLFKMWNSYRMQSSLGPGGIAGYLPESYIQGEGSVTAAFDNVKESMDETGGSSNELKNNLKDLDKELKSKKQDVNGVTDAFNAFKRGINNLGITKLTSQFLRIAKLRLIRYVIREITSAFGEGIENVYHYSQAIDSAFATSMDNAATALQTMKNSIGASLAPLLQSLIPYLQILVNWFVKLINYANQFFALLNGQTTWTHAIESEASAFDDVADSATGASAAVKDLLADWDELNIIQSDSSSGGNSGTSAMEDYLNMFEEVSTFDNRIKEIVNFIQEHFKQILDIAKDIGIAILAWKLSNAFTGPLGTLFALVSAGKLIEVTWEITELFDNEYMRTGDKGWLVREALANILGDVIAGTIVGTVLGGGIGLATAGFSLTVSGGISYGISMTDPGSDRAKVLATFGLIKAAIGTAAMAAGFGIASGSALLGLASALTIAAPLFVLSAGVTVVVQQLKTAEEIAKQTFAKTGEGGIDVDEVFAALQTELTTASSGYELVINAFMNVPQLKSDLSDAFATINNLTAVIRGDDALTQDEADKFNAAWTTIFDAFRDITADSFSTVFTGLNESLSSENETIRKQARELRISLLMLQGEMSEWQAEWELEMNDLKDKVVHGKATNEEVNEYLDSVEKLAMVNSLSFEQLDSILSEGKKIDFGEGEAALENLNQFLLNSQTELDTATATIDEGLQTDLKALDEIRKRVEFYKEKMGDEKYNYYVDLLNTTEKNLEETAEKRKNKISDQVQDTYKQILEQAMSGLDEFIKDDGSIDAISAAFYAAEVIAPVVSAIKDAGGEVDEAFAEAFGIGTNVKDMIANWGETNFIEWLKNYYADLASRGKTDVEDKLSDILGENTNPGEYNGNVDLTNRNIIPVQMLVNVGWDVDDSDGYATLFSSTITGEDLGIEGPLANVVVGVTPITPDGKVLSPTELDEYVASLLEEAQAGGTSLKEIDAGKMNLLLEVDSKGPEETIEDAIERVNEDLFELHENQEELYGAQEDLNEITSKITEPVNIPAADMTAYYSSLDEVEQYTEGFIARIKKMFSGLAFSVSVSGSGGGGGFGSGYHFVYDAETRASGGFVRSGDLVMANENGNFEMMGRMGNQPVVANNQQIVNGISQGVSNANGDVVSELRGLATMMQKMMNKEWIAKATPSSTWGSNNKKSAEAFSRVTG